MNMKEETDTTMGKWQVLYSSNTGNTQQIAAAMASALPPARAELLTVQEMLEGRELDGAVVAVGYWVTRGGPDPLTQKLLPKLHDREIVLFQTHGAEVGSEHSVTSLARAAALLGQGCYVLGTFSCQGKINPTLLEKRLRNADDLNDPHRPTPERLARWRKAASHPDAADIENARRFVAAMLRKQKLRDAFLKRRNS